MAKRIPKKFTDVLAEAKASVPKEEHESLMRELTESIISRTSLIDWARTGVYVATIALGFYVSHCNTAQKIVSTAKETKDTLNHVDSTHWKSSSKRLDTIEMNQRKQFYWDSTGTFPSNQ